MVMVGWKPPAEKWIKLNIDGACFAVRGFGCVGIIRDMHGDYKGGLSKHIRECSA